ncbi:MAG: bifunctional DNA-formamidopyrimidine glycosylase/DNA-(apurinic or apyrimidinic site) lyase [Planktomarina sp.]
MPELPEVETVRRGLLPVMEGVRIESVDVNRPDLRWPFPDGMAERLAGQAVTALRRRSKYILADLSSGETMILHLGMSGRILITGTKIGDFFHDHEPTQKHDHVVFHMEGGTRVTFNDPRRFGAIDMGPTADIEAHPLLAKLGPEPMGNTFNEAHLVTVFTGKNTPVKSALLDQRLVAGLGNIYVCEALFRTGIAPTRKAGKISKARVQSLVPVIRDVLGQAIEAGGSSLKDFKQTDGELGYFQHAFQVYDREDEPCLNTGCDAKIQRIVQSGRSTFFCPQCQR